MDRPLKGWTTAFLLLLAAGTTYLPSSLPCVPRDLERFRPISRQSLERIFMDPFRGKPRTRMFTEPLPMEEEVPEAVPEPRTGSPRSRPDRPVAPLTPSRGGSPSLPGATPTPEPAGLDGYLEDASGTMAPFQEALRRAEAGEGIARITHFGDSPITGDLISGEARSRLHQLFGNAGHGWILAGRPWEWYGHRGIKLEASGWRIHAPGLVGRKDRSYGFGGVSFTAQAGAKTQITTAKGTSCSRGEVHYLAQPGGGTLVLAVDGQEPVLLSTKGEGGPAAHPFVLNGEGPHSLSLQPKGDGEVTLYGLVLERKSPGVVYDAVGANGGAIQHLARMDAEHWIQALKLRRPDLVILGFGTNECGYYNIPGPAYVQDYREVVRRIRKALPKASILIMAPMDRGQRGGEGGIETMPALIRIVDAQRQIARELGCAFFDTFRAMGGAGSAGRWYVGTPRLMTGDLIHPTHTGADRLARHLIHALRQEYVASAEALADFQEERAVAEARAKGGEHHPVPRPQ